MFKSIAGCVLLALLTTVACGRSSQSYLEQGNRFFRDGKFAEAELQYRNAIQRNSKFGEAYLRLGVALLQLDDAPGALDAFTRAVDLMPANQEAKVRLADLNLLAYLNDPKHSTRFYNQIVILGREVVKKDPNSPDGLRLKGALALIDRKPEQAVAYYRKANELNPGQIAIVAGLTEALSESNQPEESERVALSFLATQRSAVPVYDLLYRQYVDAGRETDAENLLKRKIENNPDQVAFRLQLAQHYLNFRKPAEMTAMIEKLLKDPRRSPSANIRAGDFYNAMGNHEESLRVFEEGIRDFPQLRVSYRKKIAATLASEGKKTRRRR